MTTVVTAATDADTEPLCAIYFELFTHQHRGRPDLFREPRPEDPEQLVARIKTRYEARLKEIFGC